ncbi:hypothetical protein [Pontiella sp.]|uniref:hypothetical protein n=1 Tax=Pontiella sp. TaxID=2837462 RepID=UPI003563C64F
MILMIPITYGVIKKYGTPPSTKAIIGSTLQTVTLFGMMFLFIPFTPDGRSGSFAPLILTSFLAGTILATIDKKALKLSAVLIILVGGYALTAWANELVHGNHYIANKNWTHGPALHVRNQAYMAACHSVLKDIEASYSNPQLPEGWIEEATFKATGTRWFEPSVIEFPLHSVSPFWHSWFTHIYRLEKTNGGIWCPGGTAEVCRGNLEMRMKPGNPPETTHLPE